MKTRGVWIATAVLGVAGLVLLLVTLLPRPDIGSQISSVAPGPQAPPTAQTDGAAAPAAGRVQTKVPRAVSEEDRPVQVRVASADIDAVVRAVGVTSDGQMELPSNPQLLGWYRFGASPGSGSGSVVLAGHLDSKRYGLGPLVGLRKVEVGDKILLSPSRGEQLGYTVVDVRRYDRQALPDELFARSGPERLRVITCGGEFLPEEGGYQQNLVVTAIPR